MVTPRAKRPVVEYLKQTYSFSERRACQLIKLNRSSHRYHAKPSNDDELKNRLIGLATTYPSYGYLMLHGMLKLGGLVVNKKRTYRVYTQENLQVRTKKRKKLQRPRQPILMPIAANLRWSMDFVSDQLSDGRRFRVLNIVDDYTRECIGQFVDTSTAFCFCWEGGIIEFSASAWTSCRGKVNFRLHSSLYNLTPAEFARYHDTDYIDHQKNNQKTLKMAIFEGRSELLGAYATMEHWTEHSQD